MTRITDPLFQLPEIIALTAQNIFDAGTTKPILISGLNNIDNNINFYVIKPKSNSRMKGGGSMREFLASFIALELELNVPLPAVIKVTEQFIESTRYTDNFSLLQGCNGNNFGSIHMPGFITLDKDISFFKHNYTILQKILIFDIFISTSDRREVRPNMADCNGSIYIYDHELAFLSFAYEIIPNPKPWLINDADRTAIEGHILYSFFKSNDFKCDDFLDSFAHLNNSFWDKAQNLIPVDLLDLEQFKKIKNNLSLKIEHLGIFRNEIKKVLLC